MTDPTNDYRVTQPPPCEGCGDHHGGPTAELLCLRQWLRSARAKVDHYAGLNAHLNAELEPIRLLRMQVAKQGASWPPHRK